MLKNYKSFKFDIGSEFDSLSIFVAIKSFIPVFKFSIEDFNSPI